MNDTDKQTLIERYNHALDEIRPHLLSDGGNVEVIDVSDDLHVKVRWLGNCQSCAMSAMTMKAGIESTLKSKFADIASVEAV